jgi:hypothetical protein
VWKDYLLKYINDAYAEPLLNLHFLGPYLKCNGASLCSYEMIFKLIDLLNDDEKNELLKGLSSKIENYKNLLNVEK